MSENGNDRWTIDPSLVDPSGGQREMQAVLPGHEGLPFRGVPYERKETDPDHLQPKVGARVHVEVLEMSKVEDRKRMEEIYTAMTNGAAVISVEERHWDEDIKSWRVLIRWADLYTYNPQATRKGYRDGHTR
jgi:hypothetical protein